MPLLEGPLYVADPEVARWLTGGIKLLLEKCHADRRVIPGPLLAEFDKIKYVGSHYQVARPQARSQPSQLAEIDDPSEWQDTMTTKEAAVALGISEQAVRAAIKGRRLEARMHKGAWQIDSSSVEGYEPRKVR